MLSIPLTLYPNNFLHKFVHLLTQVHLIYKSELEIISIAPNNWFGLNRCNHQDHFH